LLHFDRNVCIYAPIGEKRFAIYDTKKQSYHEFGEIVTVDNCPPERLSNILQGFFTSNAKMKKMAWASRQYDIFEIYDYSDTGNIKAVKQYVGVLSPASFIDGSIALFLNNKVGIMSITSSDKYIYALYNEKMLKSGELGGPISLSCNKILVYDWDGNPVKNLKVDKKLSSISFNETQQTLYCLGRDDAEYEVYAIPVKDLE
jgi:hypothetical protein